jgi:hypothetical protein
MTRRLPRGHTAGFVIDVAEGGAWLSLWNRLYPPYDFTYLGRSD